MKQIRIFMRIIMIVLVIASSFETVAQKHTMSSKKNTTSLSVNRMSSKDLVESLSREAVILSAKCPINYNDLIILESASFKNKCFCMTMYYTDNAIEKMGEPNGDYSYMDYGMGLSIAKLLQSTNIPVDVFARSGISFKCVIKDNKGGILWSKEFTSNEAVGFYKDIKKKGEMPSKNNTYNLEYFRQLTKSLNMSTPQDMGDNIVLTSITMEEKNICYNIQIPVDDALMMCLLSEEDEEENRQEMAAECYEFLSLLGANSNNRSVIDQMISLEISIKYRYYIEDVTAPVKVINLPASYIKRVGMKK